MVITITVCTIYNSFRWEGPSSTTRSFDSDDILFVEENPYGDFSSAAWGAANLSNLSEAAVDVLTWLDTSFMSSPAQCYVLEGFYESCLAQVTPDYLVPLFTLIELLVKEPSPSDTN